MSTVVLRMDDYVELPEDRLKYACYRCPAEKNCPAAYLDEYSFYGWYKECGDAYMFNELKNSKVENS